eukprot:9718707-Alexandrium_andersonii.AAC.1
MVRRPAGMQVRTDAPPARHMDAPLRAGPLGPPGMRMRAEAPPFWPCWWAEEAIRELQEQLQQAWGSLQQASVQAAAAHTDLE